MTLINKDIVLALLSLKSFSKDLKGIYFIILGEDTIKYNNNITGIINIISSNI